MGLKIEYLAVADLVPYAKNARMHSGNQLDQIVASINEFGFTNPVLVDENNILIAGHGRTQAAKIAGLTEVPAIRLSGLSDDQKKALRIADNQLTLNGSWDMDLLMEEVQGLDIAEFDLDLLGFDENMLETLLVDDADDIDIGSDSDESRSGVDMKYLTIDKEKVPVTDDEIDRLMKALNEYVEKYGTTVGFAKRLVEGK